MKTVNVEINVATVCDRLRKVAQNLTDQNEHTDAMVVDIAVDVIRNLVANADT